VLLGAPGSGKSTLLKAWASGISRRESQELRELIPVFVSLRSYAQAEPEQARDAAWEIKERAGLFSATEDGHEYVFAHRSLNEYCAAAALHKVISNKEHPIQVPSWCLAFPMERQAPAWPLDMRYCAKIGGLSRYWRRYWF